MKIKQLCKMVIDFIMLALLLVLMASILTGDTVHELLGISFAVLFIVHNVLNWQWYRALPKGRYDAVRILRTAVNLLLLVTMLVLIVSAMTISMEVFAFLGLNGGLIGRKVHMFAAYWGFLLMSVHLGMHWDMMMAAARKLSKTAATNRIRTFALRIAAAFIAGYGVYASFSRNISSKLTMQNAFDFWDYSKPVTLFFIDYLSIIGLYVCVTYYALKLIRCRGKLTDR